MSINLTPSTEDHRSSNVASSDGTMNAVKPDLLKNKEDGQGYASSKTLILNFYSLCFVLFLLLTVYIYRIWTLNFFVSDDDLFRLSLARELAGQSLFLDARVYWLPIPLSFQILFFTLFPEEGFLSGYIACSLCSLLSLVFMAIYMLRKGVEGYALCILFSLPLILEFSSSVLSDPIYLSLLLVYIVSTVIKKPRSHGDYLVCAISSLLLCMTRYEAWLIIALYNASLLYRIDRRRFKLLALHAPAWLFIGFWMTLNFIEHGSFTEFTKLSRSQALDLSILMRMKYVVRSLTQGTLPLLLGMTLLVRIIFRLQCTKAEMLTLFLAFAPFAYMVLSNNIGHATPERFVLAPVAVLLILSAIRLKESGQAKGKLVPITMIASGVLLVRAFQSSFSPPLIPPPALSSLIDHARLDSNSNVLIFDYQGPAWRDLQVYRLVCHQSDIICSEWWQERVPVSRHSLSQEHVDYVLCRSLDSTLGFFTEDVSLRSVQVFWDEWQLYEVEGDSGVME